MKWFRCSTALYRFMRQRGAKWSWPLSVRGNTVVLRHGLGVCSLYTHLSSFNVSEGDIIDKGTLMGYGGDTGLVTGPHLHWEIRIANIPVDPAQWANQDLGLE